LKGGKGPGDYIFLRGSWGEGGGKRKGRAELTGKGGERGPIRGGMSKRKGGGLFGATKVVGIPGEG